MKRDGRGAVDQILSKDKKIVLVKWYDNKPVHLASNFAGKDPMDIVSRYDKKDHKYVDVNRPNVVKRYNESMGGVDHLDQMIAYYRIFMKSRKWTLRVVMHFMDLAIAASWMEYLAVAKELN